MTGFVLSRKIGIFPVIVNVIIFCLIFVQIMFYD